MLQDLLHILQSGGRLNHFDAVLNLIARFEITVWPLEAADVELARKIAEDYPELSVRDLCYLANCRRRKIASIKTFDKSSFSASKTD